ncbi:hypothetical protein UZ35_04890 [Heyndrickxia coagulans]|nr:hypothetical protein CIW84_14010 [Heyndrickxia coagulans]KGB30670.1 hypothetical protein IE89_03480 [Heyndrickxia coagulans]KXT21353.1 hypothetical protein UZ35_04890 [Heyndrickxia coagulans]OZV97017.1 hypothetical protein CAY57_04450 [Heyndrickxia coagulans]RCS34635.1 hypothetical protein DN050_16825 [Heyndrickxia coagulans]
MLPAGKKQPPYKWMHGFEIKFTLFYKTGKHCCFAVCYKHHANGCAALKLSSVSSINQTKHCCFATGCKHHADG